MSDSLQPHGLQPTRLLCPWDFQGKSTGVGCHCLLQPLSLDANNFLHTSFLQSESESCSVLSNSLQPQGLYSPWNSPGQNTGVGSCSFLQGIFPTQGSNPGLLHCRQILHQLSHQGSPRILEWIAYPFLQGVFLTQESNWRFFTS